MEKIWQVQPVQPKLQKQISQELKIPPILAQLLINRGVSSAQEAHSFLDCRLSSLHDPFLLKGMDKAISRIKKAIVKNEKIMVWGDYDVDGITATALLISVLKQMGAQVNHYLPNRLEEGYGLNEKGLQVAKNKGVRLLITVDCGICAHREVKALRESGIEAIVTDHHQPQKELLPKCRAIINPWQKDCHYPYKHLSGVGLAAKLAAALLNNQKQLLEQHLDIVALGTVGDIVPLTGENRILVKHGLAQFSQSKKLGLQALMQVSGLVNREISAGHIGYILGPRINASGRLGSPEDSLRLLLAERKEQALKLAEKLNQGNRLRQKIESQTLQQAIEQVERDINFKEHNIIVLAAPNWHQGVIGIVASRLVERYLRPAILMSLEDNFGRGSGRSIGNFHLLQALTKCKDLLEEFGGHRRACGVRLRQERLNEFSQAINRVAKEMLVPEDLIPALNIDLKVPLAQLNKELLEQLSLLAPFGTDNPAPLIAAYGLQVRSAPRIVGAGHIKFWVTDGEITCEAIGYNKAGVWGNIAVGQKIDLAFTPSINNWQGNFSIQLKIEDLKQAD